MTDNITLPRKVGEHLKWVLEECLTHGDLVERDSIEALGTALAAPSEDIEALRRDAERWRWLKMRVEDYDGHACFPQVPYPAPIPDRSPFDAVDAAIDAAMENKR